MTAIIPRNTIHFSIDVVTPSNAALLRMHWAKQRRLNKDWHYLILVAKSAWEAACKVELLPAKTKRKVVVYSYRHNKIDPDNLSGGMKPLLDGLVTNKLLVDDNPDWIKLEVHSEIDRKNKRTEISICCIGKDEVTSSS